MKNKLVFCIGIMLTIFITGCLGSDVERSSISEKISDYEASSSIVIYEQRCKEAECIAEQLVIYCFSQSEYPVTASNISNYDITRFICSSFIFENGYDFLKSDTSYYPFTLVSSMDGTTIYIDADKSYKAIDSLFGNNTYRWDYTNNYVESKNITICTEQGFGSGLNCSNISSSIEDGQIRIEIEVSSSYEDDTFQTYEMVFDVNNEMSLLFKEVHLVN